MSRKVEEGAADFVLQLSRSVYEPIDELVLDVFGFSRGAATARHFVSREVYDTTGSLHGEYKGALVRAFAREGVPWRKHVTVRFLVLSDSVSAVA